MKNLWQILVNHKWAIVLAVLIGIIMALPHIYFIYENSDIYQGIMMGGLDEGFYLSRMQEVKDGYYSIASPFWAEYKNLPNLWPPLSENVAVFFGSIFGLNLINTVLFENFVFPFVIFLLIYSLVYRLTKEKRLALLSSIVISLIPNLTDPGALWRLLVYQQTENTFLAYSRLISPQVHVFFFFGFFLSFWLFLEKKKIFYGIISGIILGLSFYIYPFTWVFITVFLGWLGIIFIFRKNWPEIKNIILTASIGLIVAVPFFWNLWQSIQHPFYLETSLRFGWVKSHAPQLGATMLILLGLFLLFFPRFWKKRYDYCLAIVLTPFVIANQQIITGHLMAPARYHHYYYKPFAIIFLLIIIFTLFKKKIIKSGLIIVILIIAFYNALIIQTVSYRTHEPVAIENQRYSIIFKWLNEHAEKDESVMANSYISDLVTIYTPLNAVANLDNHYSLVSDKELLERMFLGYRLDKLKPENAEKIFFQDREIISKKIFAQRYQKQFGSYDKIPNDKLFAFTRAYQDFFDTSIEDALQKYHVRYLIWDTTKQPNWTIDRFLFMSQSYEKNGIKIYEIQI